MSDSIREAVGLFERSEDLEHAVRELESTAFPRHDISILGDAGKMEKNFLGPVTNSEQSEDDPEAPREAPIRTEEKAIGHGVLISGAAYIGAVTAAIATGGVSVPATIAAVVLGGGGGALMGNALAKIAGKHLDHATAEQINKGGLLLWVRTPDSERERIACDIMRKYSAHNIKVHDLAVD